MTAVGSPTLRCFSGGKEGGECQHGAVPGDPLGREWVQTFHFCWKNGGCFHPVTGLGARYLMVVRQTAGAIPVRVQCGCGSGAARKVTMKIKIACQRGDEQWW